MPQKKVYLGIDPGLSSTGLCVCTITKSGKVKIQEIKLVSTSSKDTLRKRYDKIRSEVRNLIVEYHVTDVICEAFEVQTWQKPKKAGTAMSKLINEISEEVYSLRIPFLLSSPSNKRNYSIEKIPKMARDKIQERPKTHRPHLLDSYIHIHYYLSRR